MKITLNSLSQSGGMIINNTFSQNNSLLKVESYNDDLTYKSISARSNSFTNEQLKSIKIFINFVLPYLSYNGNKLGLESIKNIETLYAGSFGVTIVYDDIVIKISASDINNDPSHVQEITTLENIFKNLPEGINPPPETISQYFGFMSNRKSNYLEKYSKYKGRMNILGNILENPLFSLDEKELFDNASKLDGDKYLSTNFLDTMVVIFLRREDMNLSKFIDTNLKSVSIKQKLEYVFDFLTDMTDALHYLHIDRNLMHCDIKPDNIVVTQNLDGKYKFKLIDFGGVISIDKKTGYPVKGSRPTRSQLFYKSTFHENNLTYLYDDYCVLYSALVMLGFPLYDNHFINEISGLAYEKSNTGVKPVEVLKTLINKINSKYPSINLPEYDSLHTEDDKKVKNAYRILIVYILIAPVKDGKVPYLA
jgi:serine/threonine protein kinase